MKKLIVILSLAMLSSLLLAQKPVEIKIWPNDKQAAEATLYIYPAPNPNGLAIIACPGGGYQHLATAHEGHDMAAWFNSLGITYSVLVYRMPNGNHNIPLNDAQQAIRIIRNESQRWGINKLGIMGSSAGGHLASTAATHFDSETRPDFQILFYPVITMNENLTHKGSKYNLLGKLPTQELADKYSIEKQVTSQTPPAFIIHCTDDKVVPVENSINYYLALVKEGIPASLHIYPTGGHGWGFRDSFVYKRQWTGELEKWMRELNK